MISGLSVSRIEVIPWVRAARAPAAARGADRPPDEPPEPGSLLEIVPAPTAPSPRRHPPTTSDRRNEHEARYVCPFKEEELR